jgi:hypothetical protein
MTWVTPDSRRTSITGDMRFLPAAALTLQQVQGRNKSRDGASADTAGGRLKSRIGFTAEPIHRSADPRP